MILGLMEKQTFAEESENNFPKSKRKKIALEIWVRNPIKISRSQRVEKNLLPKGKLNHITS